MDQKQILDEFGELLPKGLDYYGTVGDVPIYSSKKIEEEVSALLSNHPSTRPIAEKLRQGIDNKFIIIGYENKSKFKFLKNRFKEAMAKARFTSVLFGKTDPDVIAFYDPHYNKLVILLDLNITLLGRSLVDLPSVVIHELCHCVFHVNNKEAIKACIRPFLFPFFKQFTYLFDKRAASASNMDISRLIIELSSASDYSNTRDIKFLSHIWMTFYMKCGLTKKEALRVTMEVFAPFFRYFLGNDKIGYVDINDMVRPSMKNYALSYQVLGIKNILAYTTCGQECLVPSEVVCMTNQIKLSPIIIDLIKTTI